MTHRETWEDVKFQVFTDEAGVLRSGVYPTGNGLVSGNVQIDRVWGNIPMQPDDDRIGGSNEIGGGVGDKGYAPTYTHNSDTLRTADYYVEVSNTGLEYTTPADSHTIATTGYSNFPGFLPNYAGDEDPGLEVVVPNVVNKPWNEAVNILNAGSLQASRYEINPAVTYAVASGASVVLTLDDTLNIKKGDNVYVDQLVVGTTPYAVGYQVLTAVGNSKITFPNTAEWTFDDTATGAVWGVNSNTERVISQNPSAGSIANESAIVTLTVLYVD